jgi:hypothetical protein
MWASVELHLNRRNTLEGIHDLNAVIVWTDFTRDFATEIAVSNSRFRRCIRFLSMIFAKESSRPKDRRCLRFKETGKNLGVRRQYPPVLNDARYTGPVAR